MQERQPAKPLRSLSVEPVLLLILRRVSHRDVLRCGLVCHRWLQVSLGCRSHLKFAEMSAVFVAAELDA